MLNSQFELIDVTDQVTVHYKRRVSVKPTYIPWDYDLDIQQMSNNQQKVLLNPSNFDPTQASKKIMDQSKVPSRRRTAISLNNDQLFLFRKNLDSAVSQKTSVEDQSKDYGNPGESLVNPVNLVEKQVNRKRALPITEIVPPKRRKTISINKDDFSVFLKEQQKLLDSAKPQATIAKGQDDAKFFPELSKFF